MKFAPDDISSIAALIAIIFAILEALFKFNGQKAERNILFYSKYHYICQQMEIGVLSVSSFTEICKGFAKEEICGYAMAHMVTDDFENVVYDFEELAYSCFKGNNIEKVQKAQEFGALALCLSESINSFYQSIIKDSWIEMNSDETIERLKEFAAKMNVSLNKLKDNNTDDANVFDENKCLNCLMKQVVNKNKTPGKILHFAYIVGSVGLVLFCVFLLFCSIKF